MNLRNGILSSDLFDNLPVVHGFTTRERGNLGFGKNPGDPAVVANRRRLFHELNLADRRLIQPRQIHSDRCIEANEFVSGIEADASVSRNHHDLLSVLTADCVPILLYHPEGVVAAIHAGWRGLVKDIISKTVEKLPSGPVAVLGPSIGACCYEIGEDLAQQFRERFGEHVLAAGKKRPHLDLVQVAVLQLQQAGVEEMDVCHFCTHCHPDLFFSYRREGSAGRILSFIGLK